MARFHSGGPVDFSDDHHDCAARLRIALDTVQWLIAHGINSEAVFQSEAVLRAQIETYDLARWEREVRPR